MNYTLKELSEISSTAIIGDENKKISSANTLESANEDEVSFLANDRYIDLMKKSKAGAICIKKSGSYPKDRNFLVSDDPSRAFQTICEYLVQKKIKTASFEGIHPSAVIHPSVKIGKNVTVGPNSTIEENVEIDDGTILIANVYVGVETKIGKNCLIYPNVTLREGTILNNRVILQSGCVIGSCGFGYTMEKGKWQKLTQLGNVILEDDVEVGANTAIDRARLKSTIIKKGTKIDNLVQIAHNVEIGENSAIAAQTGIAGSTEVGNYVIMGGQVGVTGHVKIDDQVMLATRSGVSKNLKSGKYRGSPAIELNSYQRQYVTLKNLEKILTDIKNRLELLEKK